MLKARRMQGVITLFTLFAFLTLGVRQSKTVHPDWEPHMDQVMSSYSKFTIGDKHLSVATYLRQRFLPFVIGNAIGLSNIITVIDINCGFDVNILKNIDAVGIIRGFNYNRCPTGRSLLLLCLPELKKDLKLTRRLQLEKFLFAVTDKLFNADYYTTISPSLNYEQNEIRSNKLSFDMPRAKTPMDCNIKYQSLVIVGRRESVDLFPKVSSLLCRFISILMVTVDQSPITFMFNNRTGCVSNRLRSRDIGYGFLLAPNCRPLKGEKIDPKQFEWYSQTKDNFGLRGAYTSKLFDYEWNVEEQYHRAKFLYFNKFNKTEPPLLISIRFKTMLSTSYLENKQALLGALSATEMSAIAITPSADPSRPIIRDIFLSEMPLIVVSLAVVIGTIFSFERTRSFNKVFYYTFYLIFTLYAPIHTNLLTHKRTLLFSSLILTGWFQGMNIISVSMKSEVTASMNSLSESRLKSVNSCQELSEYLPYAEFLELETGLIQHGGKNTQNSTWLTEHWKKHTKSTIKEIGYMLDRWSLAGLMLYLDRAVCGGQWRLQRIMHKLDPYFDIHTVSTPSKPEFRHIVFSNLEAAVIDPETGPEISHAISVNYVDKAYRLAFETLRGGFYHRERIRTGYYVFQGGNITTILTRKSQKQHGTLYEFLGAFIILGGGCGISAVIIVIELCGSFLECKWKKAGYI